MAKNVDLVLFNGIKFRRYPDAPGLTERRYYVPGIADRKRGVKRLHEEIWMAVAGRQIPSGHHIHHRDGNHLNNDPSNLECITEDEHLAHHGKQPRTEAQQAAWHEYCRRAADWHRSPEGRAWHVQLGHRTWEQRKPHELTCERCGSSYLSRSLAVSAERFCSGACKSAARRASGVDDVDRACDFCGGMFRVNRFKRTRFCSKSCAAHFRWKAPTP